MNDYKPLDLLVIGAGMIVNDLLLPSVYHLQRLGYVKDISVCDARISSLQALKENTLINEAFPGQDFRPYPALDSAADGDLHRTGHPGVGVAGRDGLGRGQRPGGRPAAPPTATRTRC